MTVQVKNNRVRNILHHQARIFGHSHNVCAQFDPILIPDLNTTAVQGCLKRRPGLDALGDKLDEPAIIDDFGIGRLILHMKDGAVIRLGLRKGDRIVDRRVAMQGHVHLGTCRGSAYNLNLAVFR